MSFRQACTIPFQPPTPVCRPGASMFPAAACRHTAGWRRSVLACRPCQASQLHIARSFFSQAASQSSRSTRSCAMVLCAAGAAASHATTSGYLYFQTLPAQDVEYHAGQEVLVTLRSEKNTGRATILATPDTITSGPYAGRYLVHFHQDNKQCHVRLGRMTPVYSIPRSVIVCASTTDYRRLARCQVTLEDDVLEIGSSFGVATDIIAQHARSVIGIDNSQLIVEQARVRYPHLRFEVIDALSSQQPLAQLASGRPVIFVDIGGNRQLQSLVQLLPWIEDNLAPRLMVVKSETLAAAATEHRAGLQDSAQQGRQEQQKQVGRKEQVKQLHHTAQQQEQHHKQEHFAQDQQQDQQRQEQQRQKQQQGDQQQHCQLSEPLGHPQHVASNAPAQSINSAPVPAATASTTSPSAASTPSSIFTTAITTQGPISSGQSPVADGAAAANGSHSDSAAAPSSHSNGTSSSPPTASIPSTPPPQLSGLVRDAAAWWDGLATRFQLTPTAPGQPPPVEGWYLAAAQSNWRRNPLRVPKRYVVGGLQMCRFHNYRHRCFDGDDCALDHDHCHYCGQLGHRALHCPVPVLPEELRHSQLKHGETEQLHAVEGGKGAQTAALQAEAVAS